MPDARNGANLAHEAEPKLVRGGLVCGQVDDLHRDGPAGLRVEAAVDVPHAALAHELLQLVAPDVPSWLRVSGHTSALLSQSARRRTDVSGRAESRAEARPRLATGVVARNRAGVEWRHPG